MERSQFICAAARRPPLTSFFVAASRSRSYWSRSATSSAGHCGLRLLLFVGEGSAP